MKQMRTVPLPGASRQARPPNVLPNAKMNVGGALGPGALKLGQSSFPKQRPPALLPVQYSVTEPEDDYLGPWHVGKKRQ